MFFVLRVTSPTHEHTRLVLGCQEPAEVAAEMLINAGYEVEPDVTPFAPKRDEAEALRAQQLMALVFAPCEGNA